MNHPKKFLSSINISININEKLVFTAIINLDNNKLLNSFSTMNSYFNALKKLFFCPFHRSYDNKCVT